MLLEFLGDFEVEFGYILEAVATVGGNEVLSGAGDVRGTAQRHGASAGVGGLFHPLYKAVAREDGGSRYGYIAFSFGALL